MNDRFNEIPSRIEQILSILSQLIGRLDNFGKDIIPKIGKTSDSILIPVQILENGYTAVETLFLRISQAFENNLEAERWHSGLLEKMTLEIKNTRTRIISDVTYRKLRELLRFRHFKRYYFELDYDWRKIELLIEIFREVVPLLTEDLSNFSEKVTEALDSTN